MRGNSGIAPTFLAWAQAGVKWLGSRPGRSTPRYHWIGGRMGPRAILEAVRKKRI